MRHGAPVVSLEGHDGASRPIECPIEMLRVANEIAFILLAMKRTVDGEMHK